MSSNDLDFLIESFKQNHPKSRYDDRVITIVEALRYLSYIECINESYNITEQRMIKFYTEHALKLIQESVIKENTFKWPFNISPYFIPEEIEQFKGYYSEATRAHDNRSMLHNIQSLEKELRDTIEPDEIKRIKSEIDALSAYSGEAEDFYESTATQFEPKSWNKKIVELTTRLKYTEEPEEIDRIKQALIDLGWNPEIEYNAENQIKAKERIESIYQEKYKNIFTLDISSLVESFNMNEEIISEGYNDQIKPIHIVVIKGKSTFSDAISFVSKSPFSHASVCVDNDFNKLYSFNLVNGINKLGGFSIESIEKYPEDGRLAVFSFFVTKEKHDRIMERINLLTNNIDKTVYGAFNILLLPFKHINLNLNNSMICSQFVDSIIKMADVDITGKDSSKVLPHDFYVASTSGKIYKIFDGIRKDFNPKKAIKYVNKMASKVKPITENDLPNLLDDYIYPTIIEAKLPIQFNKDGDVLITNTFVDFDREFSASHKLLLQYAKTNNMEGMKYELARLYYMNYILERRLYHNKLLSNKEKNIKTRARVLNDFNKYIKFVLVKEPEFNFSEYYENSIFYPHTVEVKSDTILKLKDIINYIL